MTDAADAPTPTSAWAVGLATYDAASGKVLDTCAIYPHQPQKQWDTAKATLGALVARHGVELIAVGNGTGGAGTRLRADAAVTLSAVLFTRNPLRPPS